MKILFGHSVGLVGVACALLLACDGDDDASALVAAAGAAGADSGGGSGGGSSGGSSGTPGAAGSPSAGASAVGESPCAIDDGQCIFRHDTFGDEQLWTDTLRLHELVQGLAPVDAVALGLKVDAEAVPEAVLASADLTSPETTVALLGLNAVVGVRAEVSEDGQIERIGITCALCHSTVDDSVMAGVGVRLDGWPNRDLDPGKIIASTPGVGALAAALEVDAETALAALNSWGPGYYDARFNQDKQSNPTLIPPAYGLEGVALETYTGEGPISYWNAYVAVTQMGGHGSFSDERVGLEIVQTPDRVTPMLPALRDYQFTLEAPPPPEGSFDATAAERGQALFAGAAQCATCHSGARLTDAPTLHDPVEGIDQLEAQRSATGQYRTTPLRGLWHRAPYFHDGSAEDLPAVVDHYDTRLSLGLTNAEKDDLVNFLLSL